MFKVLKTQDYKGMTELFFRNGLEIDPEEELKEELIQCWEIIDEDTGKRVGGGTLEKRDGEYVVGSIAIEKEYRRHDLGTRLMEQITEEVISRGGTRMMLVAKVPAFFKTFGFLPMDREKAPNISDCLTCSQFRTECFPEIMCRQL